MDAIKRKTILRERVLEQIRGGCSFESLTSSKRNVAVLTDLLSAEEPPTRMVAAACLCTFARKGRDISNALPKLEEIMRSDPDSTVRMHAEFLAECINKVPEAIRHSPRHRKMARDRIMEEIRSGGSLDSITSSKSNIPALIDLLSAEEPTARMMAAACLCRFAKAGADVSKALPKLEEMMASDQDRTVRMHAEFVAGCIQRISRRKE